MAAARRHPCAQGAKQNGRRCTHISGFFIAVPLRVSQSADAREAGERARRLSVPYACQQSAELYLTVGTVLKKARLMASSPSSTLGLDKEFTPLSRLNARVHGFAGRCAALPAMILYTLREP